MKDSLKKKGGGGESPPPPKKKHKKNPNTNKSKDIETEKTRTDICLQK